MWSVWKCVIATWEIARHSRPSRSRPCTEPGPQSSRILWSPYSTRCAGDRWRSFGRSVPEPTTVTRTGHLSGKLMYSGRCGSLPPGGYGFERPGTGAAGCGPHPGHHADRTIRGTQASSRSSRQVFLVGTPRISGRRNRRRQSVRALRPALKAPGVGRPAHLGLASGCGGQPAAPKVMGAAGGGQPGSEGRSEGARPGAGAGRGRSESGEWLPLAAPMWSACRPCTRPSHQIDSSSSDRFSQMAGDHP